MQKKIIAICEEMLKQGTSPTLKKVRNGLKERYPWLENKYSVEYNEALNEINVKTTFGIGYIDQKFSFPKC